MVIKSIHWEDGLFSLFMTYHWICNKSDTTGVTGGARSANTSPQALVARTTPLFSNFLFTNLFSIKFLYYFISFSLF